MALALTRRPVSTVGGDRQAMGLPRMDGADPCRPVPARGGLILWSAAALRDHRTAGAGQARSGHAA